MPAGRPSEYRPEFCEVIIELGKQGKSAAQFCAALEISPQCFSEWRQKHKEFGEAFTVARVFSQNWWEQKGQDYLVEQGDGVKINAGLYAKSMACRFPDDWRDNTKTELSGPNGGPILLARAADDAIVQDYLARHPEVLKLGKPTE